MTEPRNGLDSARRNANISLMLFALGGVIGLIKMFTTTIPFGKGFEMVALAENLARSGAYANPYPVLATGPTAANPPMYPLLLAILFKTFKSTDLVLLAATLGVVFANAITAAWLPRVSRLFYRDIRPGVVAAVLWLLSMPLLPSWDASHTVATLLAFCLLSSSGIRQPNSTLYGLAAGLLAGALFLFNPLTMLIFLPWLVYIAYGQQTSRVHAAGSCLAACAVLAMVACTWMFRNHQQLGGFTVRTNLGTTLYMSNNDCAKPSLFEEEKTNCSQAHNPNTNVEEAKLLRSLGEIEHDRVRIQDAQSWIRTNPTAFAWLSLARIRNFWFPELGLHPFESVVIWISTLLSILGLLLMSLRRESVTLFVFIVLFIYPLIYYIVESDLRYRIPILWLSLLPAGYFVSLLMDGVKRRLEARESH
jgi:hypothetical protein